MTGLCACAKNRLKMSHSTQRLSMEGVERIDLRFRMEAQVERSGRRARDEVCEGTFYGRADGRAALPVLAADFSICSRFFFSSLAKEPWGASFR